jgi:hypothetical protein
MNDSMTDFVSDEQDPLGWLARVFATDGPTLFVKECPSTLEGGISGHEQGKLEIMLSNGPLDQLDREVWVHAFCDKFVMELSRCFTKRFESIHAMNSVTDSKDIVADHG